MNVFSITVEQFAVRCLGKRVYFISHFVNGHCMVNDLMMKENKCKE